MSIQIDDGEFTRIHNKILEGLARASLTAMEYRCILFLVRMTYGWQKKEDAISLSQWTNGIGIDKSNRGNVLNTLNGLVAKGVIYTRSNGNNRPATWGLIKAYFEKPSVMQSHNSSQAEPTLTVIPEHNTTVMQPHNTPVISEHNSSPETVMQPHNHKRKVLKKKQQKKEKETIAADAAPVETPEWQEFVSGLCNCCYKHTDISALSAKDKGMLLKEAKAIHDKGYTLEDIRAWYRDEWVNDWRYGPKKNRPNPSQVRSGIPAIRAAPDEAYEIEQLAARTNGYMSKGERQEAAVDEAFRILEEKGIHL